NYGAIVGMNNGTLTNNYFDNQMCVLNGIGNVPIPNVPWQAEGMPTPSMLGSNLQYLLKPPNVNNGNGFGPGCNWHFEDNLYPRLGCYQPNYNLYNHPISLLAAAPIRLQDNPITGDPERLDNVTQDFHVSNWNPPFILPDPYRYLWGWYPSGIFTPFSMMNYISVPLPVPPYSNNAAILVPRGGWDTLAVRLDYPIYGNNGFYPGYLIIFEKQVPLNVRP
ncbi:MAG: hypothetical protein FWG85_07135, partial [Bacteroidetes bacterium]|nr:hypothetical protein [Bacteroidota bacterium]